MQNTNSGRRGFRVSRLALGMMIYEDPARRPWVLGLDEARHFVKKVLESGEGIIAPAEDRPGLLEHLQQPPWLAIVLFQSTLSRQK